jgi:hypothetical protein
MADTSVFHHTRVQPFANEAHQHPIAYPLAKYFAELCLVE